MNKDIDRILSWNPCTVGLRWAETQSSLEEVWNKCEETSWLFFICQAEPELNLKKEQSVTLAIAFANRVLDKFEVAYPDDKRPRKAIEAAQAWLDNPIKENAGVAHAAAHDTHAIAYDARDAAYAAYSARDAAYAAAYSVADAAYAAARAAARAADASDYTAYDAERKAQADIIRLLVPNPFK